jgi:5-methylcytosine-specific restriction endonuclease McrA
MKHIPARLRQLVLRRSGGRCEYCRLSQVGQEATFHIDHIKPVSAGGETAADNLALACVSCSLRKAARETSVDSETGEIVPIFNPRADVWTEHFRWQEARLIGTTAIGRATIDLLDLNRPVILAIRFEEAALGRHP